MERLQEFFSRRVAGIPVGIIAVVVAAVVLVLALRMKGASTDTADTATDEPAGDASNDVENPVFEASPKVPTVIAKPQEDTNELWGQRAREWLIGQGMSPTDASTLIAAYLNEDPINSEQKNWLDKVIGALGYPPDPPTIVYGDDPVDPAEPPPPVETPGTPGGGTGGGTNENMPPTPQGTPPTHHTVMNSRDNGAGELARIYYGSNAPQKVVRLEAANWEIGPGPWAKGTRVTIPADHDPKFFRATHDVRGLETIAAKNGVSKQFIKALNPGMDFPVSVGTQVRVN